MTVTQQNTLFDQIPSLPIDIKTRLVDTLLESLNPSDSSHKEAWIKVVQTRKKELEQGIVSPIDGEQVFKEIIAKIS